MTHEHQKKSSPHYGEIPKIPDPKGDALKEKYLRSCKGKVKFDSPSHAAWAKGNMAFVEGEKLNVYRCRFCKHWHLGHKEQLDPNQVIASMIQQLDEVLEEE